MRLLEVIADDLVELLAAFFQPTRQALVQIRAQRFRDPLVRSVAEQEVLEAEGVLQHLVRADELLAHKRGKLHS